MKVKFSERDPKEEIELRKNGIFNFSNLHNLYWIFNDSKYGKEVTNKRNVHFPDGKRIAIKLGISQRRGPNFLKNFITSRSAKNKKHFIIGIDKNDEKLIIKKSGISSLKLDFFNPSFINSIEFPLEERKKILSKIKRFKPDYIWIAISTPKQDLLANQLFKGYPCFYFNVGAAFDFFLERKKEAPKFWSSIGLEWLYRLIADYTHTRKKVQRHFSALKYLRDVILSNEK